MDGDMLTGSRVQVFGSGRFLVVTGLSDSKLGFVVRCLWEREETWNGPFAFWVWGFI